MSYVAYCYSSVFLLNPVYTIQPVWQPCWTNSHCSSNRVVQPGLTTGCIRDTAHLSNRLSNGFDNRLNVCIHDTIPVVKPVWQQVVSCKRGISLSQLWALQKKRINRSRCRLDCGLRCYMVVQISHKNGKILTRRRVAAKDGFVFIELQRSNWVMWCSLHWHRRAKQYHVTKLNYSTIVQLL